MLSRPGTVTGIGILSFGTGVFTHSILSATGAVLIGQDTMPVIMPVSTIHGVMVTGVIMVIITTVMTAATTITARVDLWVALLIARQLGVILAEPAAKIVLPNVSRHVQQSMMKVAGRS